MSGPAARRVRRGPATGPDAAAPGTARKRRPAPRGGPGDPAAAPGTASAGPAAGGPLDAGRISDEQIHDSLTAAVLDQRLLPGTKLVEDKLGQAYGVSRTRIRQVLIRLAQEQVVTLSPNRGATIAQPSVEEAHEVFDVRRLIEPPLLARAIERLDEAGARRLAALIQDEETARQDGDRQRALRLSGEFHLCIAELAGHRTLERLLRELVSRTSLILMSYGGATPDRPPPARRAPMRWVEACNCRDHRSLLRAMRAGDVAQARATMDRHLNELMASLCFNLPEPRETDLVRLLRPGGA